LRLGDRDLEAVASPAPEANSDMPYQIIDAVMARAIQADVVRTHPLFAWSSSYPRPGRPSPKSNAAQPPLMPRAAAELAAKQAQEAAEAMRQAAEADRRAAAAEVATARAQRDAAQETASIAVRQAQFEAEEARRALTAAAEERGRLLQRAEVAESQRSGGTEATAPIDAKPGRSRGTRTGAGEKPAT
jgi:multidrug efflux pump subunit AcrA (membrane-fusion protein)